MACVRGMSGTRSRRSLRSLAMTLVCAVITRRPRSGRHGDLLSECLRCFPPWKRRSPDRPPHACQSGEWRSQDRVPTRRETASPPAQGLVCSPHSHKGHQEDRRTRRERPGNGHSDLRTVNFRPRPFLICLLRALRDFVVKKTGRRPPPRKQRRLQPGCARALPGIVSFSLPACA